MAVAANAKEHALETFYDGLAENWHRGPPALGDTIATDHLFHTIGSLVIDMFEGHTRQLIWRAVTTETLSQECKKNATETRQGRRKALQDSLSQ